MNAMNAHLILLHIPKTAGTSINEIVTDWVGPDYAARHVELLSADERNALGNLRYISGHLFYDDIQRLPYAGRYRLAVSLREPHARLASALQMLDRYNQPENKAQFEALPKVAQQVAERLSEIGLDDAAALARFFDDLDPWGYAALDNCQTRFLACDLSSSAKSPFAELADDAFNEAIGKLEACDFIVLTEDMTTSVARLADEFAITAPTKVLHSNRADSDEWARGRKVDSMDPAIRKAMSKMVEQDLRLYEHALKLFASHYLRP
jgi:hypothetical protein